MPLGTPGRRALCLALCAPRRWYCSVVAEREPQAAIARRETKVNWRCRWGFPVADGSVSDPCS
jgi:hypothetical protein